eukprot:scaffold62495_cov72-Phaeocystis_antarctica.AAC.2
MHLVVVLRVVLRKVGATTAAEAAKRLLRRLRVVQVNEHGGEPCRVVALEPVDVVAVPTVRAIAQDLQTLGVRVTGHARQRDGAQDGSARDLVLERAAVDPEEAVEPGRFGRPDWVDDAALDLLRVASRLQDARL